MALKTNLARVTYLLMGGPTSAFSSARNEISSILGILFSSGATGI